ncbi:DinB family protein [Reichenbachiella sp.]|uniref:DinB family protein n=1 Tax=Reichenbachiella sp. TaxID=2184521 RepID=UPI003BB1A440
MDARSEILEAFDSLEFQRVQLEERLNKMDDDLFFVPQSEGRWSINQVLAHLSNSEFGTLRYIRKKMLGMDALGETSLGAKLRSMLLKLLLDSKIKFKMPRQLPEPSKEISYVELKNQFEKNRLALKELIESFPEEALGKLIFKHPFAGRFSLHQTIKFLEHHYNHHIQQIDRIIKAVENRG